MSLKFSTSSAREHYRMERSFCLKPLSLLIKGSWFYFFLNSLIIQTFFFFLFPFNLHKIYSLVYYFIFSVIITIKFHWLSLFRSCFLIFKILLFVSVFLHQMKAIFIISSITTGYSLKKVFTFKIAA